MSARPLGSWAGVTFGIGIAAFAAYHQFKLPVVLPVLLERYGYERTLAGAFVSVYALAGLMLSISMGRVVQRRGALGPVLIAMALLAAGSLLTLLAADSGAVVLAARALEGIAFSALAVAGPVIANVNAPPHRLGLVIGLTAIWIPAGQLSATVLAHLTLERFGWTPLWWLGIAAAAAVAWIALLLARRADVVMAPRVESAGQAPTRMPHGALRALVMVGAVFMIWSGQYFAFMTWLPTYLVQVHGVDVRGALLGYVVPVLFVMVFNVIAGAILRTARITATMLVAALGAQAAIWWLLPLAESSGVVGMLLLVAYGCGAGIVPTCLFAMPSVLLGAGHGTAAAFGIIMTGRNLGVLVGPVLLAYLVERENAWSSAQLAFAVATTLAVAIGLVVALHITRGADRRATT